MACITNIHATASTLRKIDEEILQLETRIISLKAHRNTLIPISSLHPEILQEIFIFASQGSDHGRIGRTALVVSGVSRQWREVAIGSPGLWSYIDFIDQGWMKIALSRAKKHCKLNFALCFPVRSGRVSKDLGYRVTSLCLGNISRISSLAMDLQRKDLAFTSYIPINPQLWMSPAPNLVDLSLVSVSLPPKIFQDIFPSLQNISLDGCQFDWEDLPLHTGVKRLIIRAPATEASPTTILRCLNIVAPELEYLKLIKTLHEPSALTNTKQVSLTKLKSLILDEYYTLSLTSVLEWVVLPTYLDLIDIVFYGGAAQYETARTFVSRRGLSRWPVHSLEVQHQNGSIRMMMTERHPREEAYSSDNKGTHHDSNPKDCQISFTFNISSDSDNLDTLLSIFPLSPIETLSLSGEQIGTYGKELAECYHRTGTVKTLNFYTPFFPTFADLMNLQCQSIREESLDAGGPDNGEIDDELKGLCLFTLTFHNLTTLCICDVPGIGHYFTRGPYKILHEWLLWRQRAGLRPLDKLVFKDMIVPSEEYLRTLYEDMVEEFECVEIQEMGYEA